MPFALLVCDDSATARRQVASALPEDLDAAVEYVEDGLACLERLQESDYDLLLLDLTMPQLDGYSVLEWIQHRGRGPASLVISGDVQPSAQARVRELGARGFLRKPLDRSALRESIRRIIPDALQRGSRQRHPPVRDAPGEPDFIDRTREVANVAMGLAADRLARLLGVRVVLPVPNVAMIETGELQMALEATANYSRVSGVSQGFSAPGVAGEALLLFDDRGFGDAAELLEGPPEQDADSHEIEQLMSFSSVLSGACLQSFFQQIHLPVSQDAPTLVGRHCSTEELLAHNAPRWGNLLAIEIRYRIEERRIDCELLLLFTGDSIPRLKERVAHLV